MKGEVFQRHHVELPAHKVLIVCEHPASEVGAGEDEVKAPAHELVSVDVGSHNLHIVILGEDVFQNLGIDCILRREHKLSVDVLGDHTLQIRNKLLSLRNKHCLGLDGETFFINLHQCRGKNRHS